MSGANVSDVDKAWKSAMNNAYFPDWPNSIEAAWELIEDIRKNGDEISINTDRNDKEIFTIVVLHLRNDKEGTGWNQLVNVESETAPLAISRAWLIWNEERK